MCDGHGPLCFFSVNSTRKLQQLAVIAAAAVLAGFVSGLHAISASAPIPWRV